MSEIANTKNQAELTLLDGLAKQARMLTENIALNMLQLGRVFTEAKQLVRHGEWSGWVQENCGMSERYAQQFMQAYSRYGDSERFAALGKSKLIRLLALPEGEEERFIQEHDVAAMSTREVDEAVRKEREKWERRLADAERRATEAENREPEIPEAVFTSMKSKDELIARQKQDMENMAEQQREILQEAGELRSKNAMLRQENEDQTAMLKDMQDDLERAQRELLDAKSELARGDAERVPADQLTPGAFASAVRQFIGTCARMPHMRMAFAAMEYQEKQAYDELLSTVEQWARDSRKALDVVMAEGSVV